MTNNPPDLKPGQHIRMTIEGEVWRDDNGALLMGEPNDVLISLVTPDGKPFNVLQMARVQVLTEPRLPDPGGLGTVVLASTAVHPTRRIIYRDHKDRWNDPMCGTFRDWDELIDPEVLNQGWTR